MPNANNESESSRKLSLQWRRAAAKRAAAATIFGTPSEGLRRSFPTLRLALLDERIQRPARTNWLVKRLVVGTDLHGKFIEITILLQFCQQKLRSLHAKCGM